MKWLNGLNWYYYKIRGNLKFYSKCLPKCGQYYVSAIAIYSSIAS